MTGTTVWKLGSSRTCGNLLSRLKKVESTVNSGKIQDATHFAQQNTQELQALSVSGLRAILNTE